MSQGKDQVRERAPLKPRDKLFVLLLCELARIIFKDGFRSLTGRCVKEHDRCNVIPVGFGNTCDLLCQDPHRDAVMPGTEAEINQLARATLDIFRRGAVIEDEKGVVPAKKKLASCNHISISCCKHTINEAIIGLVFDKCGAEEHDVVKLASEGASKLVQKVLCLTRVGRAHY